MTVRDGNKIRWWIWEMGVGSGLSSLSALSCPPPPPLYAQHLVYLVYNSTI